MFLTMSQYSPQPNISFLDLVWQFKVRLAVYILFISCVTFTGLYLFNAVPEELQVVDQNQNTAIAATTTHLNSEQEVVEMGGEVPTRIVIKKIGVDTIISNPKSANNDILNQYLLKGAVRYPGSGMLGQGNVFLFGHSSSLPVINNQAYKAFNHLKDLNPQDLILVYSEGKEYTYKVFSVTLVDSDKELVDLSTSKNMLTLSTCNVFGEKQERFVIEASFASVKNRSDL
jgi:LPXTG-site transpeptidase (sortase) family protein